MIVTLKLIERIEKVEEEEEAFQKVQLFCPSSLINGMQTR